MLYSLHDLFTQVLEESNVSMYLDMYLYLHRTNAMKNPTEPKGCKPPGSKTYSVFSQKAEFGNLS